MSSRVTSPREQRPAGPTGLRLAALCALVVAAVFACLIGAHAVQTSGGPELGANATAFPAASAVTDEVAEQPAADSHHGAVGTAPTVEAPAPTGLTTSVAGVSGQPAQACVGCTDDHGASVATCAALVTLALLGLAVQPPVIGRLAGAATGAPRLPLTRRGRPLRAPNLHVLCISRT